MEFVKWPKIPRLENEIFHISEKIDGTNACIVIAPYDPIETHDAIYIDATFSFAVYAQSRKRLITPDDDNYGFAMWVYANAQQLIEDLGVGHHFGEWWGQGVQRGYNLTEKRFSLFNPTKQSSICHNVPIVKSCTQEDLTSAINVLTTILQTEGSFAAPGYMRPEGLVVYGEQSHVYWKVILDK